MQIDYVVRDSSFGKGLFTRQRVLKGSMVWEFVEGKTVQLFDFQQATDHLERFEELSDAQYFLDATYGIHGRLGLILDDGKFMNHSLTPNCLTDMSTGTTYALRDIEIGEELFEDYNRFEHPPFLFGLLQKYDCEPDYYELPPGPTRIQQNIDEVGAIAINRADDEPSEERKYSERDGGGAML